MTPAQRLARLPGCWREGMLGVPELGSTWVGRIRIIAAGPDGVIYAREDADEILTMDADDFCEFAGLAHDLTDPATAGCIEEWARELYADPRLHAVPVMGRVGDGEPAIRWRLARFGGDSLIVDGPDGRRRLEEPTRLGVWTAAILAKLEPK